MDEKSKFNPTAYKAQFNAEKYDRVYLTLPKGRKAYVQEHAREKGETLNTFIQRAINETIERDTIKDVERVLPLMRCIQARQLTPEQEQDLRAHGFDMELLYKVIPEYHIEDEE